MTTHPGDGRAGWRPIESAPKDGKAIITLDNEGNVASAQWCSCSRYWVETWSKSEWSKVTHWMPLPDPPQ